MTYNICPYSKSQIDKAGLKLIRPTAWGDETDIENTVEIIDSFRGGHNYPLLVFRIDLTTRARKVDATATVAQRLKRLPSIEAKLRRLSTRLTQMEDIGGCRAVVRTVGMVRRLETIYRNCRTKHRRLHIVDYLNQPRDTGYRGVHFVYAYNSRTKPMYNGLKIEIQLRSRFQHAWATATETVDTFTVRGLKDGSGDPKWQRFFALMGTYIANKEKCRPVPGTPSDANDLRAEIRSLETELNVRQRLESYRATLRLDSKSIPTAHSYLLQFDASKGETYITGFKKTELQQAQQAYSGIEKFFASKPGLYVVLVSVGSLESLKKAYPNYFADTGEFMTIVSEAIR